MIDAMLLGMLLLTVIGYVPAVDAHVSSTALSTTTPSLDSLQKRQLRQIIIPHGYGSRGGEGYPMSSRAPIDCMCGFDQLWRGRQCVSEWTFVDLCELLYYEPSTIASHEVIWHAVGFGAVGSAGVAVLPGGRGRGGGGVGRGAEGGRGTSDGDRGRASGGARGAVNDDAGRYQPIVPLYIFMQPIGICPALHTCTSVGDVDVDGRHSILCRPIPALTRNYRRDQQRNDAVLAQLGNLHLGDGDLREGRGQADEIDIQYDEIELAESVSSAGGVSGARVAASLHGVDSASVTALTASVDGVELCSWHDGACEPEREIDLAKDAVVKFTGRMTVRRGVTAMLLFSIISLSRRKQV